MTASVRLFISCFLHQTTTVARVAMFVAKLFISCFLHQTTTGTSIWFITVVLFISCFLHQTTTRQSLLNGRYSCLYLVSYIKPQLSLVRRAGCLRCLYLVSYIKPQLLRGAMTKSAVVYILFPTSNHNFLFLFCHNALLFISCFLHQTTTEEMSRKLNNGCLYLVSYIKPQPLHAVTYQ